MTTFNVVVSNTYRDSVLLMRLSQDLARGAGIRQATAMMGTPNNRALLDQAGLLTRDGAEAGPNDLIVAVQLDSSGAGDTVADRVREMLTANRRTGGERIQYRPRSLDGALDALPGANLALISVPGQYAAH